MFRFIILAFCFASLDVKTQPVSVDLSLSNNQIVNAAGSDVNANTLTLGQVVRIRVVVGNFVSGVAAPAGHFRIRIGLGNGLVLNPGFNLATAPLSSYFSWSIDLSGSQPQIVGNSIAPLPAGFAEFADFEVNPILRTTSTVSFNFLIANPAGTTTPLSDPSPSNNSATNTYSVPIALPVNFTRFTAVKKGCDINVTWATQNQLNLKGYEVQISKDNTGFTKVGELPAKNTSEYSFVFTLSEPIRAPSIFIRLKSIELDGTFSFSNTIRISGSCDERWQLKVFPNPANNSSLTLSIMNGIFNGKYKISVYGMNGQLVQEKQMELKEAKSFLLSVGNISSGKYHIKVSKGAEYSILEFEKL